MEKFDIFIFYNLTSSKEKWVKKRRNQEKPEQMSKFWQKLHTHHIKCQEKVWNSCYLFGRFHQRKKNARTIACTVRQPPPPACLKTRETLAKRCWPCTSRRGELGLAKQLRKTGKICNYYIFMAFCESFKTDRYQAKLALKEVEQRVADTKCSMMAVFFEYQGLVSILVIGILYIFKQRHLVTRHCEPYHARMQCLKCEGLGTCLPS